MTSTAARLPVELCDIIVDYARHDLHLMRRLAHVSKAWHARSAVWLYHTIQVVDDLVGDFRYIREGAPYVTMRMRTFVPFLAHESAKPASESLLRHARRLRIACFWHDDEDTWSEFVSAWLALQFPPFFAVQHLQVYVESRQSVGSLLQALAFHFSAVQVLDVYGTFAEGADMATCFAAFRHVSDLRFQWRGAIARAVLDVLVSAPNGWLAAPHKACRITTDVSTLRPLLLWFSARRHCVRDVLVENVLPTLTDDGARGLVRVLQDMPLEDRNLIKGIHLNASQVPISATAWRNMQMAMERCRRLRFLHITAAYGSDTQYPPMGPERHEEFDPIHTITFMLKIRWETPGNTDPFLCRSLRVLLIELKVPSEDLSLLWYHDWAGLDRVLDSAAWDGLQKLVVSICVTESDAGGDQHKAVERFLRGRLPACAAQLGFLETRCCEVPRRALSKRTTKPGVGRAEDKFIDFGHSDFVDPGGLHMVDYLPKEVIQP